MDVQRGDQVYYRGEVWTVDSQWRHDPRARFYVLKRTDDQGQVFWAEVRPENVRRVEQVR